MIPTIFRRLLGGGWSSSQGTAQPPARSLPDVDFRELAEGSADVIFRIGPDQVAHYVSPSSTAVFGWTPEEMLGRGPHSFVYPEDLPKLMQMAARIGGGASDGEVTEFRLRRKDGALIWVESNSQLIRNPETGENGDLIVAMRDISERKKLEQQLAAMANTDGLTGLANRRAFDEMLDRAWAETVSTRGQMSLLLIDVDHFKAFNDSYGHQVGDDCLRAIAAALREARLHSNATIARYGGEEIAVILPFLDSDDAAAAAEQARQAILQLALPHRQSGGDGVVTISVGAATALARVGGSMRMPEALLAAADTALYKAKQNGRNRVEMTVLLARSSDAGD